MAAVALESAVQTSETFAVQLIRTVGTVGIVVTAVTARDTFAISTAEFRGGTIAVLVMTQLVTLIVTIGAIVFKVACPAARDTALVLTLEFSCFVAFRAVLCELVRS